MSAALKRNLGLKTGKPRIEIKLDEDQKHAFTPTFTSLDQIKGQVIIECQNNLAFDDIFITFEGSTRTTVEKIATTSPTNGKTDAFQNFLRLTQPIAPCAFPHSRLLEAHKQYVFPFHFVVPDALLPNACTHPKSDNFPNGAHLSLPPSLGDAMVAAVGKSLVDDMCPDLASIVYAVKCRITDGRTSSGRWNVAAENSKKLRIVPVAEEGPPLDVQGGDQDDYKLRKEKSIQRGMFRKKLGRITAEAAQPKSLRLHSIHSQETCPVTTMATLRVRFDPADEKAEPPKLTTLAVKLKVGTFYASLPLRDIPHKSNEFHYSSVKCVYVDSLPLSSRCLDISNWTRHQSSDLTQANASAHDIPAPSSAYQGKCFYTTSVIVPISLPNKTKYFVPTFHSCLMSRVYALDLNLAVGPPKATVTDTVLHLKLPIQVSCEPNPRAQYAAPPQLGAIMDAGPVDEHFEPRTIAPPRDEYLGHSNISSNVSPTTSPPVGTTESTPPSPRKDGTSGSGPPSPRTGGPTSRPSNGRQHIAFAEDAPPSPGPGYTHRSSWEQGVAPNRPPQSVRMMGAQQRFQSLSFDDEDVAAIEEEQGEQAGQAGQNDQPAQEAPPGYNTLVGGRWRHTISSNASRSLSEGGI